MNIKITFIALVISLTFFCGCGSKKRQFTDVRVIDTSNLTLRVKLFGGGTPWWLLCKYNGNEYDQHRNKNVKVFIKGTKEIYVTFGSNRNQKIKCVLGQKICIYSGSFENWMKEWNFFEETVTVWSDSSAYFVELQIATPEAEKLESSIVIIAYTAP